MKIYLTGVFVAALINLIKLVVIFFLLSSTKSKNLKKVGLYFNPVAGNYISEKTSWKYMVFLTCDMLFITPLLSWLSVGYAIFNYIRGAVNKVPVPEAVKELNFKLSSVDLPKEIVQDYMKGVAKFFGLNDTAFDARTIDDDDDVDHDLFILEPAEKEDDWYRDIRLDRSAKYYTMYSRTPDYLQQFTSIHEYKFEGTDLWTRTVEDKEESAGDRDSWDIKDNVVLEYDVRTRMANGRWYSEEDIANKIIDLRSEVEWHEIKLNRIKYFIMFRHSDLFLNIELRKYFRSEFERIKHGYKIFEDEVIRLGGYIVNDPYFLVKPNEDMAEENLIKLRESKVMEEENLNKLGVSYAELSEADIIKQELEKYLDKLQSN